MRIFSSAKYYFRIARRMSQTSYLFLIGTWKALRGFFSRVDVALRRALHSFEIFEHHGSNCFEQVRCLSHGISPPT
jgi:hypothetical protein